MNTNPKRQHTADHGLLIGGLKWWPMKSQPNKGHFCGNLCQESPLSAVLNWRVYASQGHWQYEETFLDVSAEGEGVLLVSSG